MPLLNINLNSILKLGNIDVSVAREIASHPGLLKAKIENTRLNKVEIANTLTKWSLSDPEVARKIWLHPPEQARHLQINWNRQTEPPLTPMRQLFCKMPIKNSSGFVTKMLAACQDVTDENELEQWRHEFFGLYVIQFGIIGRIDDQNEANQSFLAISKVNFFAGRLLSDYTNHMLLPPAKNPYRQIKQETIIQVINEHPTLASALIRAIPKTRDYQAYFNDGLLIPLNKAIATNNCCASKNTLSMLNFMWGFDIDKAITLAMQAFDMNSSTNKNPDLLIGYAICLATGKKLSQVHTGGKYPTYKFIPKDLPIEDELQPSVDLRKVREIYDFLDARITLRQSRYDSLQNELISRCDDIHFLNDLALDYQASGEYLACIETFAKIKPVHETHKDYPYFLETQNRCAMVWADAIHLLASHIPGKLTEQDKSLSIKLIKQLEEQLARLTTELKSTEQDNSLLIKFREQLLDAQHKLKVKLISLVHQARCDENTDELILNSAFHFMKHNQHGLALQLLELLPENEHAFIAYKRTRRRVK